MSTALSNSQVEAQFAAFGASCEKILARVTPESELGDNLAKARKKQKVVSDPLYAAIQEIIAACRNTNCELAHELLGVKSLICGDKVPNEPFWEIRIPEEEQSVYGELDGMEYQAAMALNQIPRGLVCLTSQGAISAAEPTDPLQSPTLQRMIETYKRYQSR